MQQGHLFGCDLTNDAHRETRARKRLTPHDLVGQAQLGTDRTNLVLEQGSKRFDKLEIHVFGQATHVVVALDLGRVVGSRLDHIWVQRPLHQELRSDDFGLGSFEDSNELLADRLALGLGFGHAVEVFEEPFTRVDVLQFDLLMTLERLHDLVGLVLAHQAGVDVHTRQSIADRLVHQRSRNRGVDTTGERTNNAALIANLLTDEVYLGVDNASHRPRLRRIATVGQEPFDHLLAVRGVNHLGVVLHTVEPSLLVLERRDRRIGGSCEHIELIGEFGDGIEVAHPNGL